MKALTPFYLPDTPPTTETPTTLNWEEPAFEAGLDTAGIELLRPARKGEKPRPGQRFSPWRFGLVISVGGL